MPIRIFFKLNSFGDFNLDEKYNLGEYNIHNLPDFNDFDGVILELTNVALPECKASIIERVLEAKIPAISLVEEIPGLYYAGIDNYAAMCEIVEHVITKHGARTLNFVGGPEDSMENQMVFHTSSPSLVAVLIRNGFFLCSFNLCAIKILPDTKYSISCVR